MSYVPSYLEICSSVYFGTEVSDTVPLHLQNLSTEQTSLFTTSIRVTESCNYGTKDITETGLQFEWTLEPV